MWGTIMLDPYSLEIEIGGIGSDKRLPPNEWHTIILTNGPMYVPVSLIGPYKW